MFFLTKNNDTTKPTSNAHTIEETIDIIVRFLSPVILSTPSVTASLAWWIFSSTASLIFTVTSLTFVVAFSILLSSVILSTPSFAASLVFSIFSSAASLTSPATSLTFAVVFSAAPSNSVYLSSVTLPTVSFKAPLA